MARQRAVGEEWLNMHNDSTGADAGSAADPPISNSFQREVVFAGGGIAKTMLLAEWWERVMAALIDLAIVGIPIVIALFLAAAIDAKVTTTRSGRRLVHIMPSVGFTVEVVGLVLVLLYFAFLDGGQSGQTVGKRVMGIATRDARNGESAGAWRSALRRIVWLALLGFYFLPGLVDSLWPLWSKKRQTVHDYVARTVVVKVPHRLYSAS